MSDKNWMNANIQTQQEGFALFASLCQTGQKVQANLAPAQTGNGFMLGWTFDSDRTILFTHAKPYERKTAQEEATEAPKDESGEEPY